VTRILSTAGCATSGASSDDAYVCAQLLSSNTPAGLSNYTASSASSSAFYYSTPVATAQAGKLYMAVPLDPVDASLYTSDLQAFSAWLKLNRYAASNLVLCGYRKGGAVIQSLLQNSTFLAAAHAIGQTGPACDANASLSTCATNFSCQCPPNSADNCTCPAANLCGNGSNPKPIPAPVPVPSPTPPTGPVARRAAGSTPTPFYNCTDGEVCVPSGNKTGCTNIGSCTVIPTSNLCLSSTATSLKAISFGSDWSGSTPSATAVSGVGYEQYVLVSVQHV
jgi:hypothetical protein